MDVVLDRSRHRWIFGEVYEEPHFHLVVVEVPVASTFSRDEAFTGSQDSWHCLYALRSREPPRHCFTLIEGGMQDPNLTTIPKHLTINSVIDDVVIVGRHHLRQLTNLKGHRQDQ